MKLAPQFSAQMDQQQLLYEGEVNVYARTTSLPRVFIARTAIFEPNETKAWKILRAVKGQLGNIVVINHKGVDEIIKKINKDCENVDDGSSFEGSCEIQKIGEMMQDMNMMGGSPQ